MKNLDHVIHSLQSGNLSEGLQQLQQVLKDLYAQQPELAAAALEITARYKKWVREQAKGSRGLGELRIERNQLLFETWELITALRQAAGEPEGSTASLEAYRTKVLWLSADPEGDAQQHAEVQLTALKTQLEAEGLADRFEWIPAYAPHAEDLIRVLLTYKPEILHFSGPSGQTGICLLDADHHAQEVTATELAEVFQLFHEVVGCMLLAGCYQPEQAAALERFIPYVGGTLPAVEATAASPFIQGFYQHLGKGKPIPLAFEAAALTLPADSAPSFYIHSS